MHSIEYSTEYGYCRVWIHSKLVRDMIITYNQMHRTGKYSQHSSIIWSVWPNVWVFVCELSGCGFKSRCCYLNYRYGVCLEQGVPLHPGKLQSVDSLWNPYVTCNNIRLSVVRQLLWYHEYFPRFWGECVNWNRFIMISKG